MIRIAAIAAALAGCVPDEPPHDRLSAYALFEGDGSSQTPRAGVMRYELNAPLFSDHAAKDRFIVLPPGGEIGYRDTGAWDFPRGTILVKTFSFWHDVRDPSKGRRLVETRLLIHLEDGWRPYVYLWNEAQTEATRHDAGAIVDLAWIGVDGARQEVAYRVPNTNQCLQCHGQRGATLPIGPRTEQLHRGDQIERMASAGMFAGQPTPAAGRETLPDPYVASSAVERRARAWLEANCAHCHRPDGAAVSTNLYLAAEVTKPIDFGVCRIPNSAGVGAGGRKFDIVPGRPEESVLSFRIRSDVPAIKMPEMGAVLTDLRGVEVVDEWIRQMPQEPCL